MCRRILSSESLSEADALKYNGEFQVSGKVFNKRFCRKLFAAGKPIDNIVEKFYNIKYYICKI